MLAVSDRGVTGCCSLWGVDAFDVGIDTAPVGDAGDSELEGYHPSGCNFVPIEVVGLIGAEEGVLAVVSSEELVVASRIGG